MKTPTVLFVCVRNSIRSAMAESLCRKRFGPECNVSSCGIAPAEEMDPFTHVVLEEFGCDLTGFEPVGLAGIGSYKATLVISLANAAVGRACDYARDVKAEFLSWNIPDPSETIGNREQRLVAYRETMEAINTAITDWISQSKSD